MSRLDCADIFTRCINNVVSKVACYLLENHDGNLTYDTPLKVLVKEYDDEFETECLTYVNIKSLYVSGSGEVRMHYMDHDGREYDEDLDVFSCDELDNIVSAINNRTYEVESKS